MKRLIFFLIPLLLLSITSAIASNVWILIVPKLNVRDGPSTTYPVIGSIGYLDGITILDEESDRDWARISYSKDDAEISGWVCTKYLQKMSEAKYEALWLFTLAMETIHKKSEDEAIRLWNRDVDDLSSDEEWLNFAQQYAEAIDQYSRSEKQAYEWTHSNLDPKTNKEYFHLLGQRYMAVMLLLRIESDRKKLKGEQ